MYDHAKAIRHALLVAKSAASQVGLSPIYKAIGGYLEPTAQHMPTSGITGRDKGGAVDVNPNYEQNLAKHMEGAHPNMFNADGTPKVWYHATNNDFDKFDQKEIKGNRAGWIHVSDDPKFSNWFIDHSLSHSDKHNNLRMMDDAPPNTQIMPLHINAKNPFDYENPEHVKKLINHLPDYFDANDIKDLKKGVWHLLERGSVQDAIKELGHDAAYNSVLGGRKSTNGMPDVKNLAVFSPHQIKSAIGNNGDFAPGEPIHKAEGGFLDPDASIMSRIRTDPQQQLQSRLAGPQIMKEPGGQWLSGSVEDALPKRIMASQSPRVSAVNDFVSKQLTRYIKNDMGTEGDPIRALAERGILHYEPAGAENEDIEYLNKNRKQKRGLAINPLAKDWENHSDLTINSFNKNQLEKYRDSKYVLEENPWINKLEPNDVIHNISAHPIENLGFKHLIDELHNSTNPESGLPNHLQLRPESLSRMSVPQAVQHVHNINKWREENRLDANKEKAFNPATFLHKDYPDSDYAWYQIRHPDMTDKEKKLVYTTYTKPEDYPKKLRDKRNALEKALEYEGDTMGNCVGGYTDKVIWGNDIYSLRNKKTGEPHVTIETIPFDQNKFELPREIEQIKGKGNKKPANRYLPYVHDFVKSGNWSKVNELQNTDLVDLSKNIEHQQIAKNHGRFHTKEEANKLLAQHYGKGSFNPYATGGAIIAKAVGGSIDPQKAIRQALMVSKGMKNATC